MNLNRLCTQCFCELNIHNTSSMGYRNGKLRYSYVCKPCRSKIVTSTNKNNLKKKEYCRKYWLSKGRKYYPCLTCNKLCIKKYAKAFCSDECRFLFYVDKQNSCWIWIGAFNKKYGKFSFRGIKADSSHRVSYKLFKGEIGDKLVCHSCDVSACVNPDHLWLGDHQQNMLDMVDKDRQYSKLGSLQVYKIRKMWSEGYSQKEIQKRVKVSSSQISNIVARRIWKHI